MQESTLVATVLVILLGASSARVTGVLRLALAQTALVLFVGSDFLCPAVAVVLVRAFTTLRVVGETGGTLSAVLTSFKTRFAYTAVLTSPAIPAGALALCLGLISPNSVSMVTTMDCSRAQIAGWVCNTTSSAGVAVITAELGITHCAVLFAPLVSALTNTHCLRVIRSHRRSV